MLINVRGTSGSGKSTAVLGVLAQCPHEPIYGVLGSRCQRPTRCADGKRLRHRSISDSLRWLRPRPALRAHSQLIEKYAQQGHVVFEGMLVGTCYGVIGQLLMETRDSVVMFLDTPLEVCIARVEARRKAAGNLRPFNPRAVGAEAQHHRSAQGQVRRARNVGE